MEMSREQIAQYARSKSGFGPKGRYSDPRSNQERNASYGEQKSK